MTEAALPLSLAQPPGCSKAKANPKQHTSCQPGGNQTHPNDSAVLHDPLLLQGVSRSSCEDGFASTGAPVE